MKTIVLLGVGSTYFTKGIVENLIRIGEAFDLRLVDIDEDCLDKNETGYTQGSPACVL